MFWHEGNGQSEHGWSLRYWMCRENRDVSIFPPKRQYSLDLATSRGIMDDCYCGIRGCAMWVQHQMSAWQPLYLLQSCHPGVSQLPSKASGVHVNVSVCKSFRDSVFQLCLGSVHAHKGLENRNCIYFLIVKIMTSDAFISSRLVNVLTVAVYHCQGGQCSFHYDLLFYFLCTL